MNEGAGVRDGIFPIDKLRVALRGTIPGLLDTPVSIADEVALKVTPIDNGIDVITKEDPVIKPVPSAEVELRELEAVFEANNPVERGTDTDAVPSGALELLGGNIKADDEMEPVERGTKIEFVAVSTGKLEFTAIGIVLEAAVPVGRNTMEVLEIEPRRGPSDAEKFPEVDIDIGLVPREAVTRGTEVTLEDP